MNRTQPGTSAFRRSVGWLRTSRRVDPLRFAQRDFNAIAVCLSRGLPHDDHAIFVFIFVDDVYFRFFFVACENFGRHSNWRGLFECDMVPSPSAVMHDKIRKAQEARRARLRTRLEEMAVSGAPAPHVSDEARPPPESALVPERRALRASPKSPKVAFALSQDGASDTITPYAADAIGLAPTTRSAPAAAAEEEGKPPWAGLRLEIASPPAAQGAAGAGEWAGEASSSLMAPDTPRTAAERMDFRDAVTRDTAVVLHATPLPQERSPSPAGQRQAPTDPRSPASLAGQPLQRVNVDGLLEQMRAPRRMPGEGRGPEGSDAGSFGGHSEAEGQDSASPAFRSLDVVSWVSPVVTPPTVEEYHDRQMQVLDLCCCVAVLCLVV